MVRREGEGLKEKGKSERLEEGLDLDRGERWRI